MSDHLKAAFTSGLNLFDAGVSDVSISNATYVPYFSITNLAGDNPLEFVVNYKLCSRIEQNAKVCIHFLL